jgi:ribonuclease HI
MSTYQIKAWVDGSAWNETGQGGWCAIVVGLREDITEEEVGDTIHLASEALSDSRTDLLVTEDDESLKYKVSVIRGYAINTTNNRMEMHAILGAIRAMKHPCAMTIYSDSKVAIASLKNQKGKSNLDLVDAWVRESSKFRITFEYIPGHSGHPIHEWADKLASYKEGLDLIPQG